jgi:hypothetical protein
MRFFLILVLLFTILIVFIYSQTPLGIAEPEIGWTKIYQGYEGKVVLQTYDGGYILIAMAEYPNPKSVFIIKTDTYGDTLWMKKYGKFRWDHPVFIQQTSDSGYVIAIQNDSSGCPSLLKIDSKGDSLWQKIYTEFSPDIEIEYISIADVKETTDNGFIAVGCIADRLLIFKLNNTGEISWLKVYNTLWNSEGNSVQVIQGG